MRMAIHYIALILLITVMTVACGENTPPQEPVYTVDFQYLPGYWTLNNYETHTKSNNNTIILNTNLDGSLGISFHNDGTLQILENDTIQADGTYTPYPNLNMIGLSELILAEGIEPSGVAKLLFPIISNNTVDVNELVEKKMIINVPYDESNTIVAYFSKK